MNDLHFFAALLVGMAGGVHCLGMCGGIVVAMSAAVPKQRSTLPYALAYNAGRIVSYTLAGALTGLLGQMASTSHIFALPVLSVVSGTMLVLMGAYLGQWFMGLRRLEQIGALLWQRIHPFSKRFVPFKTPLYAFPYGFIWGWLPCGLVYSSLTWSLASGSMLNGAVTMLAFGLGTLPSLLLMHVGAHSLSRWYKHKITRRLIALVLINYGLYLIYLAINSIN